MDTSPSSKDESTRAQSAEIDKRQPTWMEPLSTGTKANRLDSFWCSTGWAVPKHHAGVEHRHTHSIYQTIPSRKVGDIHGYWPSYVDIDAASDPLPIWCVPEADQVVLIRSCIGRLSTSLDEGGSKCQKSQAKAQA